MGQLFFGLLIGTVGFAYIVYGKRRTRVVPLVSGVLLCVYPYFVSGWVWLSLVAAVLLAAPFVIDL